MISHNSRERCDAVDQRIFIDCLLMLWIHENFAPGPEWTFQKVPGAYLEK
jgi:hypothetical protein